VAAVHKFNILAKSSAKGTESYCKFQDNPLRIKMHRFTRRLHQYDVESQSVCEAIIRGLIWIPKSPLILTVERDRERIILTGEVAGKDDDKTMNVVPHVENSVYTEPGTLLLLRPRGFCAGVIRAIDVVRMVLEKLGPPVFVRREIVHNRYVVDELASQGAVFVENLEEVPTGAAVIFSAHGVSPAVREEARARQLHIIDATCPLVTKVHLEVIRYARENYTIVLIGHRDHDEMIGTLGEAPNAIQLISSVKDVETLNPPDPNRIVYLTQTTLSLDDTAEIVERLKERFPAIVGPPGQDICYATQNRQMAVKAIAPKADGILVVGAQNSSNSNRLVEVARRGGTAAYLIGNAEDILPEWVKGRRRIGVTAGASTPEVLVRQVVDRLKEWGFTRVEEVEWIEEDVRFALPAELKV
jgi:4-hydroxy-3-methylbut-2-en-1-yl diphosphate reductase